jgi:hypothetical protein
VKVDPAATRQEPSVALGLSPSLGEMELMIASIRSDTWNAEPDDTEPDDTADTDQAELDQAQPADTQPADTDQAEPDQAQPADTQPADTDQTQPPDTDQAEPDQTQPADTNQIEPADTEKTDTARTGPEDADTVEMPLAGALPSGDRHPHPQPPEQRVPGPVPVQKPAKKKRWGSLAVAAAILAALLIGAMFYASRDMGDEMARSDATVTATVSTSPTERSDESTGTGTDEPTIHLEDITDSARPLEAVRIQGTYRGGANTFMRVQRWEDGEWVDFPIPTKTDQSGHFTTYVQLGQPGRYQLRLIVPDTGLTSRPFGLVIKG